MRRLLIVMVIVIGVCNVATCYAPITSRDEIKVMPMMVGMVQGIKKPQRLNMVVTAYTAGDDYTPGVIMANGEHVHIGAVACNDLPLGTRVVIDGNVYTVKDRMAKGGMVDVYMDSKADALRFGKQNKTVVVLEG